LCQSFLSSSFLRDYVSVPCNCGSMASGHIIAFSLGDPLGWLCFLRTGPSTCLNLSFLFFSAPSLDACCPINAESQYIRPICPPISPFSFDKIRARLCCSVVSVKVALGTFTKLHLPNSPLWVLPPGLVVLHFSLDKFRLIRYRRAVWCCHEN